MRASWILAPCVGLAIASTGWACSTNDPPASGENPDAAQTTGKDSTAPPPADASIADARADSSNTADAADAEGAAPTPDLIIGYTGSGATKGAAAGNGALNIGREFQVTATGITLRDLGVWDEGQNGLAAAHTVTLFSLDKAGTGAVATPVAGGSISVPAGTAADLADGFRFAPLAAPLALSAGYYAVVAYGMSDQDPYGDNGNIPCSAAGISDAQFDAFQFVTAASPAFPNGGDGTNHTSASFRFEKLGGKFLRIFPFGDSITDGYQGTNAGYRGPLGALLKGQGIAYQFVGVATDNAGSLARDEVHHEGHSGFVIASDAGMPRAGIADSVGAWLGPGGVDPDVILLMIGTNDIDTNFDLANAGARLDGLITKMIDKTTGLRPRARLIVAQIVPINDTAEDAKVVAYNAQVATLVSKHKAAGESIAMVDMHSAIQLADLADKLHPNDVGYGKMAAVWLNAITGK